MSSRLAAALLLALSALPTQASRAADSRPIGPRILHVPQASETTDQGILTPVPVALDVPLELPARRVLLHYHVFGAQEWRTLELRREGQRYAGAIPCLEVSEMTSEIRYYIRVHDADGAVIAFSGTRSSPYVVKIHHPSARPDLSSGVVHCPDPAECPPGLAGCPSEEVERIPCQRSSDCEGGLSCGWDGFCGDDPRRKNWFGLDLAQSAGMFTAQGACSVTSQENAGYACYRARDGAIYKGRPVYSDEAPGVGWAPSRVLVSYERLLFYNTSLGLRVGYAFAGSGPTLPQGSGFVPYSAELVARYWLGKDPFARAGWRAFVGLAAGFAEVDIKADVRVREDPLMPYGQGGNDLEQTLHVWKRAGDGLISLGAGAMYPLSEGFGISCELSVGQAFPYAASVATASAGIRGGVR
jgi:hypothetical protein